MNSSGKVLVIFLVIIAMLLISLTAISLFFFQKETERRKFAEVTLKEYQTEKVQMEEDLTILKKQNFLLQEKNKESEARVNDLSDELELESGLREEMKLETVALEEKLKKLEDAKKAFADEIEEEEELHKKLTKNLAASEQKIKELEAQLKAEIERSQKLGELYEQKQQEEASKLKKIQDSRENTTAEKSNAEEAAPVEDANVGIELEEIVIIPRAPKAQDIVEEPTFEEEKVAVFESTLNGRILSVDTETEFVIVSLGEKDGLDVGNILSVYHNENYVGDIKITRLQSEMSAADLVLPLSIRNVQKNDQVKTK